MTPRVKRRLRILVFILFGSVAGVCLLLSALGENMNHYYELSVAKSDHSLIGKKIRIGGVVQPDSIERTSGSLKVSFGVTNFSECIQVTYEGVLPDLFQEGKGVLVKGHLIDAEHFVADEILAKHDENYMPKEVQEELEKKGLFQHMENSSKK